MLTENFFNCATNWRNTGKIICEGAVKGWSVAPGWKHVQRFMAKSLGKNHCKLIRCSFYLDFWNLIVCRNGKGITTQSAEECQFGIKRSNGGTLIAETRYPPTAIPKEIGGHALRVSICYCWYRPEWVPPRVALRNRLKLGRHPLLRRLTLLKHPHTTLLVESVKQKFVLTTDPEKYRLSPASICGREVSISPTG